MNNRDRDAWAKHLLPQAPVLSGGTKWKNVRCEMDGYKFDSLAEQRRYVDLRIMQKVGLIADLECHRKFRFVLNGFKLWTYTCDFAYRDVQAGVRVIEDVKNAANAKDRSFRRNCLMMQACFSINVKVVIA